MFSLLLIVAALLLASVYGQLRFASKGQQLEVKEGSNFTLSCSLNDLGNFSVLWLHERRVLTMNMLLLTPDPRYAVEGQYNLRVALASGSDGGTYYCQVTTSPLLQQASMVTVLVKPDIKEFPNTTEGVLEATDGETLQMTCASSGTPSPKVTWSKQDSGQPSGRSVLLEATAVAVLRLEVVQAVHAGVYTCTVSNGAVPPVSRSLRLLINYPPTILNKTKEVRTGLNREGYLSCPVRAQPEANVTWYFKGKIVDLSTAQTNKEFARERLGDVVNYSLRIKHVRETELGTYECRATNSKGTASTAVSLTAVPGKPKILSKEMAEYSDIYKLKWSVESYVFPVEYTISIKKLDSTDEVQMITYKQKTESLGDPGVYEASFTLSNLDPETTYQVTVRATNSYGEGEESDRFLLTTNTAEFTAPPSAIENSTLLTAKQTDEKDAAGAIRLPGHTLALAFVYFLLYYV